MELPASAAVVEASTWGRLMQKKFGIAVVVAIQEKVAKVAQPRPGVRKTSRRRLAPKLGVAVAA